MSREVLDSRSSYDELYDDRPDQSHLPRTPWRRLVPTAVSTKLRSATTLLAVFLVGLALGGVGWNEWLTQRDAAAARSAVSFSARVSRADATPGGIEVYLRMANNGPEAVQLEDLRINDRDVTSSSRLGADPIDVPPAGEVTSTLLLQVDCLARGAAAKPTLAIRARTIDGTTRSSELPLEDDNNRLDDATTLICLDPNDSFLPLSVTYSGPGSVIDDGGQTLRTSVSISSWTPVDVTVLEMRTATRQLSVSVEGLPLNVSPTNRDRGAVTVTWRVDDCGGTEDLRFEALGFFVDAELASGDVVTAQVQPDANLALDVATFIADTCRAA